MDTFELYNDIRTRTGGEIYIGVVGPVRTGKSTFIKRFVDLLVLPNMDDAHAKERTRDEMPQSASGKTIMTTEPKFVPKEAAEITLNQDVNVKVRLIDCVGYMVDGVTGHMENGTERQVKTPWFEQEIPFTKAAAIGTRKVIHDHSTIGVVITTDGSIGGIPRENYRDAERKVIQELKTVGKPFIVILNTKKPYSDGVKQQAKEMEMEYQVKVLSLDCEQLQEGDIHRIMELILFAFPITEVQFFVPKWVEMLPVEHKIKTALLRYVKNVMDQVQVIKDAAACVEQPDSEYMSDVVIKDISMDTGIVTVEISIDPRYYYEMLSEMTGSEIQGEYELLGLLKEMSRLKMEYETVKDALSAVKMKGYGVVSPNREDIHLEAPVIIKQGNKFGVKIHSEAPSIHMIKANIETEIAPIVGSEKQAEDLVTYIKEAEKTKDGIWGTNIFGKSIEELVMEGMRHKITMINDESQVKLQDTMKKVVNDSNGGLVCIII